MWAFLPVPVKPKGASTGAPEPNADAEPSKDLAALQRRLTDLEATVKGLVVRIVLDDEALAKELSLGGADDGPATQVSTWRRPCYCGRFFGVRRAAFLPPSRR